MAGKDSGMDSDHRAAAVLFFLRQAGRFKVTHSLISGWRAEETDINESPYEVMRVLFVY